MEQAVVLVGAEVGEVPEQAVGEPLVAQRARPPDLGQHGVVGPVVADALLSAVRALAVGGGGVSASALLPARVLSLGVRQLQEHGAWWRRGRRRLVGLREKECVSVCVCVSLTCHVDVLGLVLGGEIKS